MFEDEVSVSPETVRRLESVERDGIADLFAAAPDALRQSAGMAHEDIDDGLAIVCRAADVIPFNRLQGLGRKAPPRQEALDRALALFAKAGVANWIVQAAPHTEPLSRLVAERGLVRHRRTWAKFILDPAVVPEAATDIDIREIGPDNAMAFGDPSAEVFGLPMTLSPWLAAIVGRPGWRVFAGFDGGQVAGAAAIWISDGSAWLGFAVTRSAFRGRGLQKAMLARRIAAAVEAGCDLISTETGIPQPGEAGPSFRNIERAGFRIAYKRPNYCRPQA